MEPAAVDVVVFTAGAFVVLATVASAVRSVVLPRAIPARLSRFVFITVRQLFRLRIGRSATYERRDRVLAMYGPTSLLILLVVYLAGGLR